MSAIITVVCVMSYIYVQILNFYLPKIVDPYGDRKRIISTWTSVAREYAPLMNAASMEKKLYSFNVTGEEAKCDGV